MKLYNKHCFTANLLDLTSSRDMYVAAFSGAVPADVSELPFDVNDPVEVINNSVSICQAAFQTYDVGVARYNYRGKASGAKGYVASVQHPGYFRVHPDIEATEEIKGMGLGLADMLCASNVSFNPDLLDINRTLMNEANGYIFNFHEAITLDRIQLQVTTDGRYRPLTVVLQKYESDAWVDVQTLNIADVNAEGVGVYDLDTPLTADKVRLYYGNAPGSGVYPIGFEFFTLTEPTTQVPVEDISWFMLLPRNRNISIGGYGLDGTTACLWGTAGGPNEEQDAAFNSDNSVPGDFLKLLNLKIKALPLGDLK